MNVLITGGAGYLGSELVQELATQNREIEQIVVYDNLSRGNFNLFWLNPELRGRVRFVEADILDSHTFASVIDPIDIVFHLAARVTTPFADSGAHSFEQINHWGTSETVFAVENSNVKRFVFLSSASVYGPSMVEQDESTPLQPKTIYGRSKFNAEKHVKRLGEKIETYIVRCGNVYGFSPSMRFDGVINKFVFESNFRRRIRIDGDGRQFRAFVPIEQAVRAIARLPFSDLKPDCYNLVEQNLSVNEIADHLEQIFPELERVYVNQDLTLTQLKVKPNEELNRLARIQSDSLTDYLQDFVNRFSF